MGDYYVHWNWAGAVFVKEGKFFEKQGGLTEKWGRSWVKVSASSIEDARRVGRRLRDEAKENEQRNQ